jgi:2-oxoglutarate ferredoxin oxidoreductase subunit gamma
MTHEIIVSGFGGQGVLLLGQLLGQAGMEEGRNVSWLPSYGPEMRGGTAYCSVIISDERIGSPVVEEPTLLVAMNLPSMLRFAPALRPGGILVANVSLISARPERKDITLIEVPMNDLAAELRNPRGLNVIGLGVVAGLGTVVGRRAAEQALNKMFGEKFASKPDLLELNRKTFEQGTIAAGCGIAAACAPAEQGNSR